MGVTSERLSHTIAEVYGAVGRPGGFDAALRSVRQLLNASGGMLFTPTLDPDNGGFGFIDQIVTDFFVQYRTYYHDKDPWAREGARKRLHRTGITVTDEMLLSQAQLTKEEIYADMRRWNTTRLCCSVLVDHNDPMFPSTHISLYRGPDWRPFTEDDRKQLALIAPHLLQAVKLARQLKFSTAETADLRHVLHDLNRGVMLVDSSKRLIFVNRAAELLCAAGLGVQIMRNSSGSCFLRGATARLDTALQKVLDAAVRQAGADDLLSNAAAPPPLPILGSEPGQMLIVSAVPMRRQIELGFAPQAKAIVYLEDPTKKRAPLESLLTTLFGFTPTEARLAQVLALGEEPKSVAEQFDISENTVRTHIRGLLAKTGTHRLSGLMALLARVGETQASASRAPPPDQPRSGASS